MPTRHKCCFAGCDKTSQHPDVSLHRFVVKPADIRDQWLANSGNASLFSLTDKQLHDRRVCSTHFLDNEFDYPGIGKKTPKRGAIPRSLIIENNIVPSEQQLEVAAEIPQDAQVDSLDSNACLPSTSLSVNSTSMRNRKPRRKPVSLSRENLTLKFQLGRSRRKVKSLAQKLRRSENRIKELSKEDLIEGASKYIWGKNLDFFKMQINHSNQRQWEEDEKQFALGLYYKSPKAYKYLKDIFNLPCLSLIYRWVNNINLRPGTNQLFIEQLKLKLESKNFMEKSGVLMWDEIMIKPGLEYNRKIDILEGFEDIGVELDDKPRKSNGQQEIGEPKVSDFIATHVLVFMIGGLIYDWKQPFFYVPSAGTVSASKLKILIEKVIKLAFEAGFIIHHMVCDQSSSNQSAIKKLGIILENPSYKFEDHDISFGFDAPHIFKSIRNTLINNNFTVEGKIVSWVPLIQLHELQKGKSCKAAPKLTEHHVKPKAFEKMKVKLAVQVFSNSVGAALMTATLNKEIGLNDADLVIAAATADFCIRLNRIFDCLNARSFSDSNPYRKGLSESTRVEDELNKAADWVNTIEDNSQSPAFKNLLITIKGILLLWSRLKSKGIRYILTSRLNQDKLENFFGFLRERCGYNNNPTLTQCIKNMQYAVLVTLLVPPVGTNCEADQARLLISNFNSYVKDTSGEFSENIDRQVEDWFARNDAHLESDQSTLHTTVTENPTEDINTTQTTPDTALETPSLERQTKKYIAGYLAYRLNNKHHCTDCFTKYTLNDKLQLDTCDDTLLFFKAYPSVQSDVFGSLNVPSDLLFNVILACYEVFDRAFQENARIKNISAFFYALVRDEVIKKFPTFWVHDDLHHEHQKCILESFVYLQLKYRAKWISKDIRDKKRKNFETSAAKPNPKLMKLSQI
ncbi:hypothetical protein TKK_0016146 [Trichogramma kaykai]|uniref:THAP-type domain-containing protein n=1 Tax=Trichogramma kaykai TaxID=54128 RepID=A0ABD2W987_9HYME